MRAVVDKSAQPSLGIACVHGRFQPFHLGHLELAVRAYEQAAILYIGIANSEPAHIRPDRSAPHRHAAESNPFPFYERMEMVLGSMLEAGADAVRLRIVPFPINRPELVHLYVPPKAVHLLTIYDEWGQHKRRTLEEQGWRVLQLSQPKITTGTEVRRRLHSGESIQELVPAFVARYLTHPAGRAARS